MPTFEYMPKQLEFARAINRTGLDAATTIGVGGSRACGKSGGLRRVMLERRIIRPGTVGAIVRRIWRDLKENHVEKYFEEFPEMREWWREGKQEFILPEAFGGGRIAMRYAENQTAVDTAFWGPEYHDLFIDQAEQFSERELITMKTACRNPNAAVNDCKQVLFFNPGGIGTEYLRRVFSKKNFHANENAKDYMFVHMFGWDNFFWFRDLGYTPEEFYALPDEERFALFVSKTSEGRKLDSLPPSLRAGHLLGSFDSFAGQYFAGVWDESKVILSAHQTHQLIQPWWPRWISHDQGFVHNACVIWWTTGKVSPKTFFDVFGIFISEPVTIAIAYRCYTVSEVEEGELIRRCHEFSGGEKCTEYFLSVDAWEKDSRGLSPAATITEECRRLKWPAPVQAANARISGWRFLYSMLKKTCDVLAGKMNPTRGTDEEVEDDDYGYSPATPLLFIAGDCQDIIDAVPLAVRDDKHIGRGEDVLKMHGAKSDDVLDSFRYGAMSKLGPRRTPKKEATREKFESLPEEMPVHAKAMNMLQWEHKQKSGKKRKSSWRRT